MRTPTSFICLLLCLMGQAQEVVLDSFASPLDIPLVLAGTFGELRPNHFHSGIDIKTQQREGLAVYAVAEGSATRIKVSAWGYGKALYLTHPNGYTTVYAHLQKFAPKIQAYIKKIQYQKKSYEVEVFPDLGELTFEKGEVIAYSGNTGGSAAPHLHFEFRKTASQHPNNPLAFGIEARDATNPTLLAAFAYPLTDTTQINRQASRIQLHYTKQPDGSYLADPITALGTIGFGVETYDRLDMAANKNGPYSFTQTVNGTVYSEYLFDSFSFSETRYINTLIDYAYYEENRKRIQKMYRAPGNQLSIYKKLVNDGKVVVKEGFDYQITISIADYAGNTTVLHIPVTGKAESLVRPREEKKTPNYIIANKSTTVDLGGAKAYFPANTFYDNFYLELAPGKDTVQLHNPSVPAHRNFTLTFDASHYTAEERKQLFIARISDRGTPYHNTTYKRGGQMSCKSRTLGTYGLVRDSIAPSITPRNFRDKQSLTNFHFLKLRITDDLSGIDSYSATLNGKWILMEYEPKNNTITFDFDDWEPTDSPTQLLQVRVVDNVGNETVENFTFYRK